MVASHIAYSDESYYGEERYRSISMVSVERSSDQILSKSIRQLLVESEVSEFKWNKLRQARERFAAFKMIDKCIEFAIENKLRIDTLIWDTHDSRHQVPGRDDIANLQRMYYHLFKNVLHNRWAADITWILFPDENSALDWETVQDFLDSSGWVLHENVSLFDKDPFHTRLSKDFNIENINEISSEEKPICQVSDLFAGIGAFSHTAYDKYNRWLKSESGQLPLGLFKQKKISLSNSEKERFTVIKYLDDKCKDCNFRVSLKTAKGFKTFDPKYPINFWLYEPQHPEDKAPTN